MNNNSDRIFDPIPDHVEQKFHTILHDQSYCTKCDASYPLWKLRHGVCPACRGAAGNWDWIYYFGSTKQRIMFLQRIAREQANYVREQQGLLLAQTVAKQRTGVR